MSIGQNAILAIGTTDQVDRTVTYAIRNNTSLGAEVINQIIH